MNLRFVRKIILLVAGLLCGSTLMAQGWRQLAMNDFMGQPPGSSSAYIAYTNCQISYSYDARVRNGQYLLTFFVNMNMNHQKSWMNKGLVMQSGHLEQVLAHEQGHYNIAYLEQQELIQAFNQVRYGSDYQQQVQEIFSAIDKKYKNLNQDYEQDTMHMLDRDGQNQWNVWFKQQVNVARNYAYRQRREW